MWVGNMGRLPWASIALVLSLVAPAHAASVPDKQALEGLESITINASGGTLSAAECGGTAALVRSAVASRLGQAGLRQADGAPLVANVQAATLLLDKGKTCVTSVALRIGLFAFYYTDPVEKKERLGEVALVNKSGMLTSDAAAHPQQITTLVHRMLDEFTLDWREANLVAQISKVAPAAGGDPGNLSQEARTASAQRRLAELGLYTGAIDGVLGPATAQAIASFQRAYGLKVSGELDDPTLAALRQ